MTLNSKRSQNFTDKSNYSIFNNLITTKFSLLEILIFAVPLALLNGIVFTLIKINEQMTKNTRAIIDLRSENELLVQMLNDKQTKLDIVLSDLSVLRSQNQTLEKLLSNSQGSNADILIANNEMVQFWMTTCGIVLLGTLIIYTASSVFPTFFTFKSLLPTNFYAVIQNYTPFFQEKKVLFFTDNKSNADWCINLLNDKCMGIEIKPFNTNDFVAISEYLMKLNSEAGTMVAAKTEVLSSVTTSTILPSAEATAAAVSTAMSFI
jgi:hypothetical protein